ncbi:MAG: trypsin-like serine protease [Bdellovibrionaceae bacterium]|nr:trypsin-like serine protease [Pseudobdellovibrionaceae bacterium]NUM58881.1 trypsin-like serine protease [Pseudobdellovibrionaceae bacterium]
MKNLSFCSWVIFLGSFFLLFGCGKKESMTFLPQTEMSGPSQIIGGEEVTSLTDSIARVTVFIYDSLTQGKCTGTLLGNNFVLTASHCLSSNANSLYVYFTPNLLTSLKQIPQNIERRKVIAMIPFPMAKANINNTKNLSDIAIIRYDGITPKYYAFASFLPYSQYLKDGALTVLAGYGANDGVLKKGSGVLRKVTTPIASLQFSQTEVLVEQRKGKGSCHGDSGGPAFLVINNLYYLWGVASRGYVDTKTNLKDDCNQFSIYTNVIYYSQWIKEVMSKITSQVKQ